MRFLLKWTAIILVGVFVLNRWSAWRAERDAPWCPPPGQELVSADPPRPYTVTRVGVSVGAFLRDLNASPPSPAAVVEVTREASYTAGVFARSVKDGFDGRRSEKVATFEAQAVADAMERCAPAPPMSVVPGPVDVVPAASSRPGAWGGWDNGRIPVAALCGARGRLLRCDAAASLDDLAVAYERRFGAPLLVTDGYRSYEGQVSCRARKGRLCAAPGTSQHGWGLAVDLGGGVERQGSEQHGWLDANSAGFGWVHPGWAKPGGSNPEAWHWQYVGPVSAG